MKRGRPKEFDRDEALAAAMDVFWRRGFEGASCSELLDAMGINSGSMYASFGDKAALFEEAFALYERTVFAAGMEILEGDGSPLENVRNLVSAWSEFMSHPDCKGCLVGSTVIDFREQDSHMAGRAKKLLAGVQKKFEKKLALAKKSGELAANSDPKQLAAFLVNTAQGLTAMSRAGVGKSTISGVVNTTLRLLAPA